MFSRHISTDPYYGKAWDLLANIKNYRIKEASKKGLDLGQITITTKDEDGNTL